MIFRMTKWLLLVFFILGAYYYLSPGLKSYTEKNGTNQKPYAERDYIAKKLYTEGDEIRHKSQGKKLTINKNIQVLENKHKAIKFDTFLKNHNINLLKPIYTLSLQKAFSNLQGKPIAFNSYLIDYSKKGQQYFLVFYDLVSKGAKIRYELECSEEQTKKIVENPIDSSGDRYAVIAAITDIRRPKFSVRAFGVGENEAEIEVESSDIFIARGRCLDLVYIGGKFTDKELP